MCWYKYISRAVLREALLAFKRSSCFYRQIRKSPHGVNDALVWLVAEEVLRPYEIEQSDAL
ncbi:hypothetical protein BFJ69_g18657 [Fusarium oxysporum]|jgi:hypothetical protein|uniref:Uncharacterized protein n=1 Tax=Fusarium oxysporum TaxID=5507 RepID=A0A420M4T0_FUSOX|nr:hypothetical protein BFJ69_g18657 [Fusarium oxysporum]